MKKKVGVIRGDCSSREIVEQTLRVLNQISKQSGVEFEYIPIAMGGDAIDTYGEPLPQSELDKACLLYTSDAADDR